MTTYSCVAFTGDGGSGPFSVPFPYLDRAHVVVRVDGATAGFTWQGDGSVLLSAPAAAGAVVEIRRETPKDVRLVDFTDGSVLTEADLDRSALQQLYLAQELADQSADALRARADGAYDLAGAPLRGVATPVASADAATKGYVDATFAQGSSGAAASAAAAEASRQAADAAASAASASQSAAGSSAIAAASSASAAHADAASAAVSASSAQSAAASAGADGGVTTAKLADGAVTQAKISASAVGTEAVIDGALTGAKLAVGAVDATRIAADAVTASRLADGAATTPKIANAAVTSAKLAGGAVDAAALADGAVSRPKLAATALSGSGATLATTAAPGAAGSLAMWDASGDLASGVMATEPEMTAGVETGVRAMSPALIKTAVSALTPVSYVETPFIPISAGELGAHSFTSPWPDAIPSLFQLYVYWHTGNGGISAGRRHALSLSDGVSETTVGSLKDGGFMVYDVRAGFFRYRQPTNSLAVCNASGVNTVIDAALHYYQIRAIFI